MSSQIKPVADRGHGIRRLTGRDLDEVHRSATPLELLYDLTFVVAFGTAANELSHYLAEGEIAVAVAGFCFALFAVTWAWINYSWFASAYDEDDWVCRLATMVQMVGVVILALGLHEMFASIGHGDALDNGVMVSGYVVVRIPMIFQWLRAARDDVSRRDACLTSCVTLALAQVGWVALIFLQLPVSATLAAAIALAAVEVSGPVVAERRMGGTPWHARHITERYGLLVIITLGEGIFGTVAAINALVHGPEGWSLHAVSIAIAGIGLTFGLWWTYFILPSTQVLRRHRERVFAWGYGHILIFGSLAAAGAGGHVGAYYIEGTAHIGPVTTLLATAVPVGIYLFTLYALYAILIREFDPFHIGLLIATVAVLVLSVVLAAVGVTLAWCLIVLAVAPVVTVVGYETLGHQHQEAALARMTGTSDI